jgi:pimeloyl-ACP methyl ester carboxylesterase
MKSITALLVTLALVTTTAFSAEPAAFTVKVTGHGRPMILIPGLSCPGEVWDSTVEHFKDRYECHVLSLAGFGGTPAKTGPVLEPARDALVAYIESHKLARPVIIGHSLGGFLTLALGANKPDLVGPLIVVDGLPFFAGVTRPGITAEQARASAVEMKKHFSTLDDATYRQTVLSGAMTRSMVISDKDHERIVAWGLASDRATVAEAMTDLFSADLREDLARISSPSLVLVSWAGYKPYTDRARTEAIYREQYYRLRDVNIAVSDTAHHFIMLDEPQWMFEQIETFLNAHPSTSK